MIALLLYDKKQKRVSFNPWPLFYREEKYDVTLLKRDGYLHCRTMEQRYGLPFCSWVQSRQGKSLHVNFFSFLFLKPYLQKQGLWRSRNFVSMVTWRNDFFSLFQSLSSPFQTLLALQTNQYEVENTTLPLAADWFAPNKVDSPNVTIEWIVTIETKASLKDTVKWTCKEA